jgi:hypothetical protein
MPRIVQARSIESALKKADEFRKSGEYDWFRGQLHAWPLRPSLFRETGESFDSKVERVNRFAYWAANTAGLENIRQSRDLLLAIAQHYGLPTTLLDFTIDPHIAAFFAGSGTRHTGRTVPKWSCIYCLNSAEVKKRLASSTIGERVRLLTPDVDDLWRLQAQRGVFLELQVTGRFVDNVLLDVLFPFAIIRFPFKGSFSGIQHDAIFPVRMSHLEYLLGRYFQAEYLYTAEQVMRSNPDVYGHAINEAAMEWTGEPDAFRVGKVPPIHDSWTREAGTA